MMSGQYTVHVVDSINHIVGFIHNDNIPLDFNFQRFFFFFVNVLLKIAGYSYRVALWRIMLYERTNSLTCELRIELLACRLNSLSGTIVRTAVQFSAILSKSAKVGSSKFYCTSQGQPILIYPALWTNDIARSKEKKTLPARDHDIWNAVFHCSDDSFFLLPEDFFFLIMVFEILSGKDKVSTSMSRHLSLILAWNLSFSTLSFMHRFYRSIRHQIGLYSKQTPIPTSEQATPLSDLCLFYLV